jgi:hypothetical protein
MHIRFSPQTIEALVQVISGGAGNDDAAPIGIYRSGPKLESFMRACNVSINVSLSSRTKALAAGIEKANQQEDQTALRRMAELAADPRDFLDDADKHAVVLKYLNDRLQYDGFRLIVHGNGVRLMPLAASASVADDLEKAAAALDFDTVSLDLKRALDSAESDPEDAVTSASSVVESVCRSILIELGLPLPDKKDIVSLFRAARGPLGLSPNKEGVKDEIAEDVRVILGGLATMVQGIGALRTHAGDAHGRERGYRRIDPRIARLAIHSASAGALFLIETWQKKFPNRMLHDAAADGERDAKG